MTLGFCWGGWAVFHAIGKNCNVDTESGDKFFVAAASFHPALSLCHLHKESYESVVKNVSCPVLMMPAGFDPASVREDGFTIKELKKNPEFGEQCKVVEFKTVNHGFSNRGDLKKKNIREAYEAGMKELLEFYNSFL